MHVYYFSAKMGDNVTKAFELLIQEVLKKPALYSPKIKNPGAIRLPDDVATTTTRSAEQPHNDSCWC